MIKMLEGSPLFPLLLVAVLSAVAAPAFSQAPTDAQRSAIRSQCRADYQAHCASIPPGGMASLQCLQQNMSSLSPGCQGAVRAAAAPAEPKPEPKAEQKAEPKPEPKSETKTEPKAEPKTEPAPPAAAAKPAAEPMAEPAPKAAASSKPAASKAAKKPSSAQIAAIRSACRNDYQKTCAGVPTGGAAALECLEKNTSKLSPGCERAVNAAGGGTAPPAAGGAPAAASASPAAAPAAAPEPALVLRPMRPREELFVLRSACGGDARALCGGVAPGGGRIMQCLASQAISLSTACRDVLGQFAAP